MLSTAINIFPKIIVFQKKKKNPKQNPLDYINHTYNYENVHSQQVNRKIWTRLTQAPCLILSTIREDLKVNHQQF